MYKKGIIKKKYQIVIILVSLLGYTSYVLSLLLRDKVSKFAIEFLEVMAVSFILIWLIYMVWCIYHKKNPYKIIN